MSIFQQIGFVGLVFWLTLGLPTMARAEIKVLFIGNSFTFADGDTGIDNARTAGGVPAIFNRLAQAGGQGNPTVVMQAVAGMDFRYHSTNTTTQASIKSQPWTYVVLQNYSTEPTHLVDGSHSVGNQMTYGLKLYQQIIGNSPQTRVVLEETWSRAAAHSLITGVSSSSSFASTAEMQQELKGNYLRLANLLNSTNPAGPRVVIAPVGDAWQRAGGLLPSTDPSFVDLHKSDNYHGNDNGYYLSAAVLYSHIFGVNPHGLSSQPQLAALNLHLTVPATFLEDTAWNTVVAANQSEAVSNKYSLLLDFGSSSKQTSLNAAPNDPTNCWNNVTVEIGSVQAGRLNNLVTTQNAVTDIDFSIESPFHTGSNGNGTTSSPLFPANATSDSLYGHIENWEGLTNTQPRFKLSGLNPLMTYTFTFFASRMVSPADNRETCYTVFGQTTNAVILDSVNNVSNAVVVRDVAPNAQREISVSLTPTAKNNNTYHFIYLAVMKVDAAPVVPSLLPSMVKSNSISLNWSSAGQLEWAAALSGPWTPVIPAPVPPYSEPLGETCRFYRLNSNP